MIMSARERGCRRHADCRDFAVRTFKPNGSMTMIMAMQHELDAVLCDQRKQFVRILQACGPASFRRDGRMVDQQDTKQIFRSSLRQKLFERVTLLAPELPGCHEWCGR